MQPQPTVKYSYRSTDPGDLLIKDLDLFLSVCLAWFICWIRLRRHRDGSPTGVEGSKTSTEILGDEEC